MTLSYDALGRVTQETNALGTFSFGYVGTSGRPASTGYPNGQSTAYSYRPNLEDRRLETIHHTRPGGGTLSRFDFSYDADGQIRTKTQQVDNEPATRWTYEYDAVNQLIGAVHTTTGGNPAELVRYAYAYDAAGNRTLEQVDDSVVTATHTPLDRLQAHLAGGALRIAGSTDETATVNVQNRSMAVHGDQTLSGTADVTSGTNTLTVTATDQNGNSATRTYEVDATGVGTTFVYDANGNLTSGGGRTFEWDAADRLVSIRQGSESLEFSYNGLGAVTDESLVWADGAIAESRDAISSVVKRFAEHGVQENVTAYFFTRDLLGSVTEVMDSSALRARHSFDAYGRRIRVSGDRDAEVGFARLMAAQDFGLSLGAFRDYDSSLGRWLSPDPLGYVDGPNLYAYVSGNPVNLSDPLGLFSSDELLYAAAQFSAGFGDALSFGLTARVRQAWDFDDVVDRCSAWYKGGELAELGLEAGLTGGSFALRGMAKGISQSAARSGMGSVERGVKGVSSLHHINPLKEGLFPVAALPASVRHHRLNLKLLPNAAHRQAHEELRRHSRYLAAGFNPGTTTARAVRVGVNSCECW